MGRTGSGGPSRPLERLPWPCQQGSDVPRPPGIAQPQVLGLWPGAAQLSPDPGPPAPAWKEEAKEDLPVGLWPAWKEEKASEPGDLRNLWLFLAWPAARRQVGAAELRRAPSAPCATAVPEPLHCNRELGQSGQWAQGSAGDTGRVAQGSPVPGCAGRMGSAGPSSLSRDARGTGRGPKQSQEPFGPWGPLDAPGGNRESSLPT